jgi:hypothetical protein
MNYIVGIKEVKIHDEKHNQLNRIGTKHECVREGETGWLTTTHIERSDGMVSFSETSDEMPMSCDYILEKRGDKTKMSLLIHLEVSFMKMMMFKLFMKKKMSGTMMQTLEKLKVYCEDKFARKRYPEKKHEHPEAAHLMAS